MKNSLATLFLLCLLTSARSAPFSSVDRQEAVEVGGIKQWIAVKGAYETNPILLFLHGGPGNSVMRYSDNFTYSLQQNYTVVQWDQRGSGTTAKLNPLDKSISLQQMESDAVELINYLRKKYSQDKIYLMGHSWGGFLALRVASSHPELLMACFVVNPMVNQWESERRSLDWMKGVAKEQKNPIAQQELSKVKIPFANPDQLYLHRKWLATFSGTKRPSKSMVLTWGKKWLPLYTIASQVNFADVAPEIQCPVYFFVGEKDRQTHFETTENYFKVLKAQKKDLYWFKNSGHSLGEAVKLQEIINSLKSST